MRKKLKLFLPLFTTIFLINCATEKSKSVEERNKFSDSAETFYSYKDFYDPHSFANPEKAAIKHLSLDVEVDFSGKLISGTATYEIRTARGADEIIFDTRDLKIINVTLGKKNEQAVYSIGEEEKYLGRPLTVKLKPGTERVNIEYSTTPSAAALQWLEPSQTLGKKKPFLFTQSQAILARTWIPVQDGPGIRFTYDARVKVPEGLLAVMSAENPTEKNDSGVYTFYMKQPIPAYLMALAAGDLVFEPIGDQTGVYAEEGILDRAVYEFGELDKMLATAESLYGAYRWERYDILVLPPSFPFGGMENPRLTFVTPTIISGDRSLTSLVAHELAHSWSGNLVTNKNWNDFWLNEGFTVYFENRIMEGLKGESYARMLAHLGYQDLLNTLEELKEENPEDTKLKLDLKGRDPDEGLTDVAYEKGRLFLRQIEMRVGREKFDAFLTKYFNDHAFQVMSTEDFIAYYHANLVPEGSAADDSIRAKDWIYEKGIPDNAITPHSDKFEKVEMEVKNWVGGKPAASLEVEGWSTHEWLHFIRHLPGKMNRSQMKELDAAFTFTRSNNSEIQAAWYKIALLNDYDPAYPAIEKFLVEVGRRKFLTPLYKAMMKSGKKEMAKGIFEKAGDNYHTISRESISKEIYGDG